MSIAVTIGGQLLRFALYVGLYVLLLAAWVTAAVRTAHGALRTGTLLQAT